MAQTEPDWECLVVDDASPDPTVLPQECARDGRFRLLRREVNGGVAAAQQTGLEEARAPFVAFLHSDDSWLPGKLEEQLEEFALLGDEYAAVEGAVFISSDSGVVRKPPSLTVGTAGLLAHAVGVHLSGVLFRTASVCALGFDDRLRSYEDWDLLYRLLKRFRVHPIKTASSIVRQTGSDRLSGSPWMADALERLMEKHSADLVYNVRVRSRWWYKLARAYGLQGRRLRAARALAHSVRDDISRWPRLALLPALVLGRVPTRLALIGYATGSRITRRVSLARDLAPCAHSARRHSASPFRSTHIRP
jgi:glycosyltransferase involved in cell wall biosynthesis